MVFQMVGAILLPIIMLIVAATPFEEPTDVKPNEPISPEIGTNDSVIFFILWVFWILILARILYQVGRAKFKANKKSQQQSARDF